MKRLIQAKDIEEAKRLEQSKIVIGEHTIITPSAKDLAKFNKMEFVKNSSAEIKNGEKNRGFNLGSEAQGIDSEKIYNVFKTLMDRGMLEQVLASIGASANYISESMDNGVKVIRGDSIQYETAKNKGIYRRELIQSNHGMKAGMMKLENACCESSEKCEETYMVLEGDINLSVNGKSFTAYSGDTVHIPAGAVLKRESKSAKLFYLSCP